jgi:hypothetical protein
MGTLKITPATRVLEWLAGHLRWVQYPQPKLYDVEPWIARAQMLLLVVVACLLPIFLGALAGLFDAARARPAATSQPSQRGLADQPRHPLPAVQRGRA